MIKKYSFFCHMDVIPYNYKVATDCDVSVINEFFADIFSMLIILPKPKIEVAMVSHTFIQTKLRWQW